MKKLLFIAIACLTTTRISAQITITASDMPVADDTLYFANANPIGSGFNAGDSGASVTWDFSGLNKITTGFDVYQKASKVNIIYGLTISPSAYGYKVSDSIPGMGGVLPVSINDIYNFFNKKNSPSRFIIEGFAAKISGIPTPINYSDEDEIYFFPLNYGDSSFSTFNLNVPIPSIGSLKMAGTRITKVDGWGNITTPYFKTPVNCLRVRSEVIEIDSFLTTFIKIGIPRKTVEYKFLVNGEHYPAVWISGNIVANNEIISNIRYRDSIPTQPDNQDTTGHITSISNNPYSNLSLNVYPNPANKGIITIDIPQYWNQYVVSLYDAHGRLVLTQDNTNQIDLSVLKSGYYVVQVISNGGVGYALVLNRE
ncbi:MAG: T9SS type A sorting domain-containing protein [Bacteroidetes bacterium]|nr:T9SS type A sorting domain-containing protein [Bacteroidota bacterium]